jgi:hypothetical protein
MVWYAADMNNRLERCAFRQLDELKVRQARGTEHLVEQRGQGTPAHCFYLMPAYVEVSAA